MSIQKKGDIYYVVLMYYDEKGKKKYKWHKSGTSSKEAEKLERSLRTDIDRGVLILSNKTTLKDYLNKWIDVAIRPERRPSTVANYESHIKNIVKGLGSVDLAKLTPIKIQEYLNSELKRPIQSKSKPPEELKRKKKAVKENSDESKAKKQKLVSPTTVRAQYSLLSDALGRAVKWGIIAKNPCEAVDPPQKNKAHANAYTPEEADLLIKAIEDTHVKLPVLLGLLCGLRRGEVCGLRWEDIDLDKKTANIRHSLDRMTKASAIELEKKDIIVWWGCESKDNKSVLALGPVKTDESESDIPLPGLLIPVLKSEKLAQKKNKLELGQAYNDTGFVWCWEDGSPHDPDYLYHEFIKLLERYGLRKIRFHDLRHTHATLLLRQKVDIKIVSKKLRHTKASFTADVYQHVQEDMLRDTADAMDELFKTK